MINRPLFYVILVLVLQSCFVADDIFLEEIEPKKSLTEVVEDSVEAYIRRNALPSQDYLYYKFDNFKVIVPQELASYELWQKRIGDKYYNQERVKSKISYYDSIVNANDSKRSMKIDHIFSLRNKKDSLGELSNITFSLNHEVVVQSLKPIFYVEISDDEEKAFAKYHYKAPIIKAYSYEESKEKSNALYSFFEKKLNSIESFNEKNDFLKHTLKVISLIMVDNEFDQQLITESIAQDYFITKRTDIENYKTIDFSDLFQIKDGEDLKGYYFYHNFSYEYLEKIDTMQLYIRFDPYYEVESVFEVAQ